MYISASPPTSSLLERRCAEKPENNGSIGMSLRLPTNGGRLHNLNQLKKRAGRVAYTPPVEVRKDSGEIVRPCLRRRSATTAATPCTPEHAPASDFRSPRFVHFGTDLERVRWFLKAQSPQAVCEDAQIEDFPPEELRLTAICRPVPSFLVFEEAPVVVEQVALREGPRGSRAALQGTVKVHNVAFEKSVAVRYSMDQWRTTHEASATFNRTLLAAQGGRPGVDRFAFTVVVPANVALPLTVALCVRYRVAGVEHWDSNGGANYVFRVAQPAAPAIADDDCNAIAPAPRLRRPRCQSFGGRGGRSSADAPVLSAPAADTHRYMAQSAALFASPQKSLSEFPLYQDMAWHASSSLADPYALSSPPLTSPYHQAFDDDFVTSSPLSAGYSPFAAGSAPQLAPAQSSEQQIGPIHRPVFDSDGAVRTGSPLAWSHNTTASALQC
ncbi:hypothetical protein COEREDRAFT_80631 [Coemansia reversa NRRL 1564]|uniref:CBM21 domain-containing protein n=1 Tax=Coemansia reversa (strain ATCC 12441 / NRRL 1564) TaxID=763665 RepID=A0A2G5BE72_COERN|nr:hypothetical protein COEREDRAFT_80631 [Coemansia reversa NRRL 1564]|eukprot:PIA17292.1 hypothetical protein COEREDRAFT_80631 [Coemansia reversa NRRL 1564]